MKRKDRNGDASMKTVEQLTRRNVETVSKLEAATKSNANFGDRLADSIAGFCGSVWFVHLHIIWFGLWILINTCASPAFRFDSYPFSFLTLVVSLEAIFLSAFIMISQNRLGVLSDRRAQLDLQINLLSEQENTKMLCLLQQIATQVGVECSQDPEIELLAKAVEPEALARQIETSIKEEGKPKQR